MTTVANLVHTFRFLTGHPLTKRQPLIAVEKFVRWQLGSRLLPGGAIVPFVDDAVLVVERGMFGATGNVYAGLHEFEEMSFLLHLLRSDDLFIDVGANVGSYTILAAAVRGAAVLALEPVASTAAHLRRNVRVNSVESLVTVHQMAVGAAPGSVRFTVSFDTINHVAAADERAVCVEVPMTTLDLLGAPRMPTLIKIDVEGFEAAVLQGAGNVFGSPELLGIIVELNSRSTQYGFAGDEVTNTLARHGFFPIEYDPYSRTIRDDSCARRASGNSILIRDRSAVARRVSGAPAFNVMGVHV